jgi:hypothetical protein
MPVSVRLGNRIGWGVVGRLNRFQQINTKRPKPIIIDRVRSRIASLLAGVMLAHFVSPGHL